MARLVSIAMMGFAFAGWAYGCTCVSATRDTPRSLMRDVSLVFRGTVLERKLLPQHPEMRGRRRYAVTFRVDEYWKGSLARTVTLYDMDGGTDCQGYGFEVGKEYLIYANETGAKDFRLDDLFWFGWTDVIPAGAPMLQALMACMPGGDTTERSVRKSMLSLGQGQKPRGQ